MAGGRVTARARNGVVVLEVDPDTARDIAAGLPADRFEDVIALFEAAAAGDVQAGRVPDPVMVPVVRDARHLRLLFGGEPA